MRPRAAMWQNRRPWRLPSPPAGPDASIIARPGDPARHPAAARHAVHPRRGNEHRAEGISPPPPQPTRVTAAQQCVFRGDDPHHGRHTPVRDRALDGCADRPRCHGVAARRVLLRRGHVHDAGLRRGDAAGPVAADGADDRDLRALRLRLDHQRADESRRAGERRSRCRGKRRRRAAERPRATDRTSQRL